MNKNISITSYITEYVKNYVIRDNENKVSVYVNKSKNFTYDTWAPAVINWPGCGDKSIKQVNDFIDLLEIAREIVVNLETGINPANSPEIAGFFSV